MHTFLIVGGSKEQQEKEVEKLVKPLGIDLIDISRIAPKGSIGIETVRILKGEIALKPFRSETKAVVIEDAQTLTVEAQNALLKTLEEPPAHTIIILLVSGNADLLLPTILSRAHVIEISNIKYQISNMELGARSKELATILQGGAGERLKLAEDIVKDKENLLSWLEKMIMTARQKMLETISLPADATHQALQAGQYLNIVRLLQRAHTSLSSTNINPRFTLETLFLTI